MATVSKLGPTDHGRPMTYEEYLAGEYQEGFRYELINGKLYVSPEANLPAHRVEDWVVFKLKLYTVARPEVINYATFRGRVFIPGRRRVTTPEPDFIAFRDFPLYLPQHEVRWEDVSPFLVGEVVTAEDPDKDYVRNVDLYFQVPSIREYWILEPREGPSALSLTVYRRHGKQWRPIRRNFGETYTTRLLPGFELIVDPTK